MILSDREIELALDQGRLIIDPRPDPAHMSSTAVDLRLDGTIDRWEIPPHDASIGQEPPRFRPGIPGFKFADLEKKYTVPVDISSVGFNLNRGDFVLGWTLERLYLPHTSRLCGRVEGKSSMARLGLGVHVTAPTIHAGFGHNQRDANDHGTRLRLEIWNVGPLPIELLKGMRVCKLILEEVREVPNYPYRGEFNLQGPKPKQS